jgi:hypothetical protein
MRVGLLAAALLLGLVLFGLLFVLAQRRDRRGGGGLRFDLLCTGLLGVLTAGFFWQVLFVPGTRMPAGGGDMASFLYPVYSFVGRALQARELPLWNPHLYLGMPFAADVQTALFYPLNWPVYLLLPRLGYPALELFAIAHYLIGAVCAYALARSLKTNRVGALVTGIVFAFSGFAVAHLGHVNMLATIVWLPLVMLLLRRAACRGDVGVAALAAVVLALTFLAGHPQLFLYQTGLAVVFALYGLIVGRPGRAALARGLGLLGLVLVVAVLLAGVQAVPSWELMRHSVRADLSYEASTEYSLAPLGLVALVLPHFFGANAAQYWGYGGGAGNLTEVYGYAGLFPLALAGLAIVLRRDRWTLFFVGLGVLGLLLALGGHTILQGWVYRFVPAMDKFRAYGRFLLFFDLAVAVLAGQGAAMLWHRLSWRERPAARAVSRGLLFGLGGLLTLGVAVFFGRLLSGESADPVALQRSVAVINNLVFALLLLTLGLALFWAWQRRLLPPAALAALAVALVVLDLFSANARYNPTDADPLANYKRAAVIEFLAGEQEPFRIDAETGVADLWQPNASLLYGFDDVTGIYNPLMLADVYHHWKTLGGRSGALYDLLNAKYVIGRKDVALDFAKFQLATDADPDLNVYSEYRALCRAPSS